MAGTGSATTVSRGNFEAALRAPDTTRHDSSMSTSASATAMRQYRNKYQLQRRNQLKNQLATERDKEGRTPLHYSAKRGNFGSVKTYIDDAADKEGYVAMQDQRGLTALHEAAQTSDLGIVELLTQHAANNNTYVTIQDESNRTALHYAAQTDNFSVIQFLIEQVTDKKAYVTRQDQSGRTALHYAAETGDPRVVELLVKHAVTINDKNECTPPQLVATNDPVAVNILHRKERNDYVILKDGSGQTGLHYAAAKSYPEVVHQLINEAVDKDAYVVAHDKRSQTALHYASKHGSVEIIERLMNEARNRCAYITKKDDKECSALDYIIPQDNLVVFKLLVRGVLGQVVRDRIPLLHKATKHNAINIVLFLFRDGRIDPKLEDSNCTAWDLACTPRDGRWKLIAAFIRKEADQSQNNPWMNTNDMSQVYKGLYNVACGMQLKFRNKDLDMDTEMELIETLADILIQIRREFHENQEAPKQFMRSREPSCIIQTLDYSRHEGRKLYDFISLVIPYLYIDSWSIVEKREARWENEVKNLKCLASKNRIFFEGHMPKTLDEYCSPALAPDILTSRNEDQVLWRYEKRKNTVFTECGDDQQEAQAFLSGIWTLVVLYMRKLRHPRPKRQQSGEIRKPANAVFVSQACIWQIGKQVFAPPPQSTYPDLPNTAWDRLRCSDPSVFITLFLGELVDRFNTPRPGGETLLKAYENALVFISQDVNEYTKSLLIEDIDLEQEKALFHQISDLREELSMIKYVLSQQETVWNEYTSHMWPTQVPGQQSSRDSSTRSARDKEMEESVIPRQLLRTKAKFSQYNRRITKLEEDAERVERNISTKLDLRQKHAIMREAHSAAMLSATVFGFTIITVIFAPLSFVVALFALPIDKFNEGKEGKDKDGVYSSNYIGKWSVATELASIAITLVAMWAALRFVGIHAWGKKGIRDYVSQKVQEIRTAESNYDNNPNNV